MTPFPPDKKRWEGIYRPYSVEDVERLSGSMKISHTIAEKMSSRLWDLLNTEDCVPALGAMTGGQAVQMMKAGLKAIYLSGWQVAADANLSGHTYPDQSLYPSNSVPALVRRINYSFMREDQKATMDGIRQDSYIPIVADGEAGFGGPLNVFELTRSMIEAGAAGIHYEDQLSSEKKCGHLGGKVLVPTSTFLRSLVAARFAADTMGVPTVLIARTDSMTARLITSDVDDADMGFTGTQRTSEGFYGYDGCLDAAISRGISYAPYADLLWFETPSPNIEEARKFANTVHARFPGKMLAYNCSPSFNWRRNLTQDEIEGFQSELGRLGYKFQFITLAGFHAMNYSIFSLARDYAISGMSAYSKLQAGEFEAEKDGYEAVKHQTFVGTGYFDEISRIVSGNQSSTTAMDGSTESAQFNADPRLHGKARALKPE